MEFVYATLRDLIINEKWKPGERWNALEIAEKLHVSRTPVIEASRLLEIEGLLTILPQVGLEASCLKVEEVKEIFRIRGVLSGLAAFHACHNFTDNGIEKLEGLKNAIEDHLLKNNYNQYSKANRDFHQLIYRTSNMPHLTSMLDRYWHNGSRYSKYFRHMPALLASATKDHSEILEFIKHRQPMEARIAVEAHANRFLEALSIYLTGGISDRNLPE